MKSLLSYYQLNSSSKNMKHIKSKLKEGYYYEIKNFYDKLPDEIEVPEYKTEIFPKVMTHREILDTYKIEPYTMEQAFGVILDVISTLKNYSNCRIVYFEEDGVLYRLSAFRHDGGLLGVNVNSAVFDDKWDAGSGACFSNKKLSNYEPILTPRDLETLTLRVEKLENWARKLQYKGMEK